MLSPVLKAEAHVTFASYKDFETSAALDIEHSANHQYGVHRKYESQHRREVRELWRTSWQLRQGRPLGGK
jgi:hypothetical protein